MTGPDIISYDLLKHSVSCYYGCSRSGHGNIVEPDSVDLTAYATTSDKGKSDLHFARSGDD